MGKRAQAFLTVGGRKLLQCFKNSRYYMVQARGSCDRNREYIAGAVPGIGVRGHDLARGGGVLHLMNSGAFLRCFV